MLNRSVVSPILYATPFVGSARPHKTQEGKLWLSNAEFGFSFCVAGIDEMFGVILHGEVLRIHVSGFIPEGEDGQWQEYPLDDACGISALSERMMEALFQADIGTTEFDDEVGEYLGMSPEERDAYDFEEVLPGRIYYKVVRV